MKKNKLYFSMGAVAIVVAVLPMAFRSANSFASVPPHSTTVAIPHTIPVPIAGQTNPLNLSVKGPIEHYVWTHDGLSDEVWHSLTTGEWRIVKTLPNGLTSTGIYKDGNYYEVSYQDGVMKTAMITPQPVGYTGKDSAFDGWKHNLQDSQVENSTYNGIAVEIKNNVIKNSDGSELTQKLYFDSKYHLPLKIEISSNGTTEQTQSWSYDYLQENQIPTDLFAVPVANYKTFGTSKK